MQLYSGSSRQFVDDAVRNRIAEKLKTAFFHHCRYDPPTSEVRSWQNSLTRMCMVMQHANLLRVAEVVALTWDEIHFDDSTVFVRRVKNGRESRHFLEGDEIRQLKQLRRESPPSRFVFCSERGGPLSNRSVHHIVQKAGEAAGLPFSVHPHMLRHSKGFQLAGKGTDTRAIQGYLGHRDIKSTVLYTQLDPGRFKGFGKDI